jgi:GNAT superfamily N-acetyltransferase
MRLDMAAGLVKKGKMEEGSMRRSRTALVFREVTSETWSDFETLFERRGGPKNCWCMVWRASGEESRDISRPRRKAAMKKRIKSGIPVGILGYDGDNPVAWCSVAPRSTYRAGLAEQQQGDAEEDIWSVVCFFIDRSFRGRGVMNALIAAAKRHAKAHGATVLEAYPVAPDSPSYRFGGFIPTFEKTGFVEIGRAGSRRHVVRHRLK